MPPKSELQHHLEVAKWLKRKKRLIPIFRTDYAAGLKLTPGQAKNHYRLQSGPGYPDLFIPVPVGQYHGLFIELKKDRDAILTRDGKKLLSNDHIQKQTAVLHTLMELDYAATFAVGHTQAKQVITDYLDGKTVQPMTYLMEFGDVTEAQPVDELPF
jgi:hypothetical protein